MPSISLTQNPRVTQFDPYLIILQIICIQSSLYLLFSIYMLLLASIYRQNIDLDLIFGFQSFTLSNVYGWLCIGGWLGLSLMAGPLLMILLIKRARLVLDFSATFVVYHLLFTIIYNSSIPSNSSWWLAQIIGCIGMCVIGEWLCMRRELMPILLSGGVTGGASSVRRSSTAGQSRNEGFALQLLNKATGKTGNKRNSGTAESDSKTPLLFAVPQTASASGSTSSTVTASNVPAISTIATSSMPLPLSSVNGNRSPSSTKRKQPSSGDSSDANSKATVTGRSISRSSSAHLFSRSADHLPLIPPNGFDKHKGDDATQMSSNSSSAAVNMRRFVSSVPASSNGSTPSTGQ